MENHGFVYFVSLSVKLLWEHAQAALLCGGWILDECRVSPAHLVEIVPIRRSHDTAQTEYTNDGSAPTIFFSS